MLSSITPLGERGRNRRWGATVALYVAGSLAGGSVLGLAFGAVGDLLPITHGLFIPVVAAALVAGAAALDLAAVRPPGVRRQVSEDWLDRYRGWVIGIGFGFQLGLGVVTIVTSWAVYLVPLLSLLSGSWRGGVLIGAAFGLSRSVPLLATSRVRDLDDLVGVHRRLEAWAAPARLLTGSALGLGAVTILGASV